MKKSIGVVPQACREYERDEAPAATKIHIRDALMGLRVNEYVSTTQAPERVRRAGEVPVENSYNPPEETDLRVFDNSVTVAHGEMVFSSSLLFCEM